MDSLGYTCDGYTFNNLHFRFNSGTVSPPKGTYKQEPKIWKNLKEGMTRITFGMVGWDDNHEIEPIYTEKSKREK
jgi:hypothetical protein